MSLDWDATRCSPAWKALEPVVQESIIWHTITAEIGTITEDTYVEFYVRVNMWEKLIGTMVQTREGPQFITIDNVRAAIGLRTNVFPKKTAQQWLAKMRRVYYDEQIRMVTATEARHTSEVTKR